MKLIQETLRKLIEFSEKQQAAQIRRLKAEGKSEKNVTVDAYANVVHQLSAILPEEDDNAES